jgi:hypothetical protein
LNEDEEERMQIEVEEPNSVRERALKIFSGIEGLDDIKEMMLEH